MSYRLTGYELGDVTADKMRSDSNGAHVSDNVYSGRYSYKCANGQWAGLDMSPNVWEVGSRYYFDALPSSYLVLATFYGHGDGTSIFGPVFAFTGPYNGGTQPYAGPLDYSTVYEMAEIRLYADGSLVLRDPRFQDPLWGPPGFNLFGGSEYTTFAPPGTITAGAWQRLLLRINAAQIDSASSVSYWLNNGPQEITSFVGYGDGFRDGWGYIGALSGAGGGHVWLDDTRWNVGFANARPGDLSAQRLNGSRSFFLRAASVKTNTGWTKNSGATTNLQTAVDNLPPDGVADHAASSDEHQIRNSGTASEAIEFETEPYTGIVPASEAIVSVVAVYSHGSPDVSPPSGKAEYWLYDDSLTPDSNETFTFGPGSTAGTYPTGWKDAQKTVAETFLDFIFKQIAVARNTGSFMRLTRTTAGIADVDLVGYLIETVPSPVAILDHSNWVVAPYTAPATAKAVVWPIVFKTLNVPAAKATASASSPNTVTLRAPTAQANARTTAPTTNNALVAPSAARATATAIPPFSNSPQPVVPAAHALAIVPLLTIDNPFPHLRYRLTGVVPCWMPTIPEGATLYLTDFSGRTNSIAMTGDCFTLPPSEGGTVEFTGDGDTGDGIASGVLVD